MQKKFSKLLYEPLVWKGDGLFKSSYTLYHEEQPIAHFRQESGLLKSDASIYLAGEEAPLFIFRPKGTFKQTFEVECEDIDFVPAKFKLLSWNKGIEVNFVNGNRYVWKSVDTWGHKWMLTSADGQKIAKLQLSKWASTGTITVVSDQPAPAELNLLIFVGWTQYLLLLQAAGAA